MEQAIVYSSCDPRFAPRPAPGHILCGKFRLLRLLGEGGMGVVFEAEHLRLGQRVAIKFLHPDALAMPDGLARFEREARATTLMRGAHVVRVLDVDTDGYDRPYMVMELVQGRDLEAELQERGRLPIAEAVDYVLQACAALTEAHAAGIVHRDLKPSNLFLTEENGARIIKVLDFGISKMARETEPSLSSATLSLGTPLYMSPEQVRCSRDVDERSDIWSLGVILFELLAGEPPFSGTTTAAIAAIVADAAPNVRSFRPEIPEQLQRVLTTALAKSPEARFPNAEAFGAALMPFASAGAADGPFSLHPSEHDYEVASEAVSHAPPLRRADPDAIARLPPARWPVRSGLRHAGALDRNAVRTFFVTMVLGMAVTGVLVFVTPRDAATSSRSVVAARALAVPSPAGSPHALRTTIAWHP